MTAAEREGCLAGTQMDILQHIFVSLIHPNPENNIIWLRGPAGAGKSTILNTVAHYSHHLLRQGAFLFWDRIDAKNSEPRHVIRTLAHQLARFDPIFARALEAKIKSQHHITASLNSQFQHLVQEPLAALSAHDRGLIIIVLDALMSVAHQSPGGSSFKHSPPVFENFPISSEY